MLNKSFLGLGKKGGLAGEKGRNVARPHGSRTRIVLVPPGPAEVVAGEEARVGDPMTRIVLVPPGPAGENCGRGRPKKNPLVDATTCPSAPKYPVDATICPSAPGAGAMPRCPVSAASAHDTAPA